jgi:hypothetical protein
MNSRTLSARITGVETYESYHGTFVIEWHYLRSDVDCTATYHLFRPTETRTHRCYDYWCKRVCEVAGVSRYEDVIGTDILLQTDFGGTIVRIGPEESGFYPIREFAGIDSQPILAYLLDGWELNDE